MSPYSCGMAAIPVRPENHGTRAAGAYGDGPCLLSPCLLSLCQLHLSAAISRLLSPGCCLQAAMLPGKCCLPPCQCVALYQPVFWMLFTTIPLVLGALVEMPE